MSRPTGTFLLLTMCIIAQLVCAALPQGAPVCIRPLFAALGESASGSAAEIGCCSDCCCDCACDEADDEDLCGIGRTGGEDDTDSPKPPCSNPECMLCIRPLHQLVPPRTLEIAGPEAWGLMPMWTVPAVVPVLPESAGRSEHPPPTIDPPRSRRIVGTVILVV